MAVERVDDGVPEQGGTGKALRRRGILAAAGAALAGIVAKQASQPVAANDAIWTMPYSATTTASPNPLIEVWNRDTTSPVAYAVRGNTASPFSAGIFGGAFVDGGKGVYGNASTTGPNSIGVYGSALNDGRGVVGESRLSTGVTGTSTGAGGIGVQGLSPNANGVQGQSTNSIGVFGASNGTGQVAGVYGVSNTAYGVIGNSTAPGFSGLTAITGTAGVAALAATSTVPNAFAAFFTGSTVVQGNLAVTGSKSAAVPHPDGSHRLLYCVEAPEAWFEDFGKATLAGGKADVALDPDFAALVDTAEYHVFLTEHGGHNGLHTTRKGTSGFVVEADGGLAAVKGQRASEVGGTFSWRVVAKRKGNPGGRLAKFAMPTINHPDPDNLPKAEAEPPILPTKR